MTNSTNQASTKSAKKQTPTPEKMVRQALMNLLNEEQKRTQDAYNRKHKNESPETDKSEKPKRVPAGQIFGLTFHKNNPKYDKKNPANTPNEPKHLLRTMSCRFGVTVGQTGEGRDYEPSDHGLIGVFEMINQKALLKRRLRQLDAEIKEREAKLDAETSKKKAAQQKVTLEKREAERSTLRHFATLIKRLEQQIAGESDKAKKAELKQTLAETKASLAVVLKPPYKSVKRTSIRGARLRGREIENTTPCPED